MEASTTERVAPETTLEPETPQFASPASYEPPAVISIEPIRDSVIDNLTGSGACCRVRC